MHRSVLAAAVTLAFAVSTAFASPITLDLHLSGDQLPLASTGLNGSGLGVYQVGLGICVSGATETTCTFAGTEYSTAGSPGLYYGDYTIITTFLNGETLTGLEDSVLSDSFHIDSAPADAASTLTLNDAFTGTHVYTFISHGMLLGNLDISGFTNTFCDDASYCTASLIANNPQYRFEGQPYSTLLFDPAAVAPTPEPSSLALLGTGALSLAGLFRRRQRS